MRSHSHLQALIGAMALISGASCGLAGVLRVNAAAAPGGNGATWATAFNSLDTALQNAAPGDQLWVVAGKYKPESVVRLSFFVPGGISLLGGFAGNETHDFEAQPTVNVTILAGLGYTKPNPVVVVRDSSGSYMSGFTIQEGLADGSPAMEGGGGVLVDGGSFNIGPCVFTNNHTINSNTATDGFYYLTGSGGALCVRGGASVLVNGCTFTNNSTAGGRAMGWYPAALPGHGGAIYVEHSSLRLLNSTISGNFAGGSSAYCIAGHPFDGGAPGAGGGIYALESQITLAHDTFSANVAGSSFGTVCGGSPGFGGGSGPGGAMYLNGGSAEIAWCTFVGNQAGQGDYLSAPGGAIYATGPLVVANSRFLGNAAGAGNGSGGGGDGGAIASRDVLVGVNCDFVGNAAGAKGQLGGGDGRGGAVHSASFAILSNCTVAGNKAHGEAAGVFGAELENSIVYANTSTLLGRSLAAQMVGGSAWYSIVEAWPTSTWDARGNFNADPGFVDLLGPDHVAGTIDDNPRLLPTSPAIDSGDNGAVMNDLLDLDNDTNMGELIPFDLVGDARRADAAGVPDTGAGTAPIVDRGAYEYFSAFCVGDLNGDQQVDDADFAIFAPAYNLLDCGDPSMPSGCPSDMNSDGFVDDADFVLFAAAYDALLCP